MTTMRFSHGLSMKNWYPLTAVLAVVFLVACKHSASQPSGIQPLQLTSSGLSGNTIPSRYTCDGDDSSPELSWQSAPAHTQSFALTVIDKDAPSGPFVHWLIYNIPPQKHQLPEGLSKQPELPDGSRQGQNDFQKVGYGGPCPPGKSPHRYVFTLYALDTKLNFPSGPTEDELQKAMTGHILTQATFTRLYHR